MALAFGLASCGFPAPEACELRCGAEGACPDGFECQAQTLLCVPPGTRELCEGSGIGSNQPAAGAPASSGAGGAAAATAAGAGGGGATAMADAGTPAAGGATAPGPTAQPPAADGGAQGAELRVEVSNTVLCLGSEPNSSFLVSGGVPPYRLRILENSAGIQLERPPGSAPDDLSLLSVISAAGPGQLSLELEDSTGKVVQPAPIIVRERPRVSTLELPVACAGLGYSVPLLAEGGQGSYQWTVRRSDGSALESLADLGLRVTASTLAGELGASTGSFALSAWVRDDACASEVVQLTLDIAPEQSEACPAILLQQAPDELPAACLGNTYVEALAAEGGEPPYTWSELELPPGLSFDRVSSTLSGVAQGPGQLRVQLQDAAGRRVEKAYPLAVRDKCWLGYVATERQPARLTLVDARLLERQPEQARRSLPPAPSSAAVLDFRFAPGGRWLAYRVLAGAARGLQLVRVSDAQLSSVDATDVDAYAFARDASALAFSFIRDGQTFLGGLDLSSAEPLAFAPGAQLSGVRALEPRAVPAVASAVVWYQPRQLAFLSPDALSPARRRLVTTQVAGDGFAPPVVHAELDFSEGATLLDSAAGVFVVDPETALTAFFPPAGGAPVLAASGAFVSPSGELVARAQAGALQLFRAQEASSATPGASASGCSTLLAWSLEREHIACADQRSSPGVLTLWQAQSAPAQLLSLGPRRDADVIASSSFAGVRRAFSPSGAWLAVGADEALHVARPVPAARLAFSVPSAALGLRASVLAFAPDERALLAGAGNTLGWLDLEQGAPSFRVLSSSALLEEGCQEDLLQGYGAWCGSAAAAPGVSWSSGSDQVAFRSTLGTLQIVDLSRARDGILGAPRSPDPSCSEACSAAGNARFQP